MEAKYINAKQVFDLYGIPRSALNELADEGRLTVREFSTASATMKLYSVEELENIINGTEPAKTATY